MRGPLVALASVAMLAGAQGARSLARTERGIEPPPTPFAPSADMARLSSLGYNELAADLLFFRMVGYFGGRPEASSTAALVEAIVALDPRHPKVYEWGARAMAHSINKGVGREHYLRAIRVLETGIKQFPQNYKLPQTAGEIYLLDLQTTDPDERRRWDERGTELLESAMRKPNAPAEYATYAATLRTRLGQKQRAIDGLREMIVITSDVRAQQQLVEKLAELSNVDSAELASELLEARNKFLTAWKRERPYLPASLFVLLGTRPAPDFDLATLATGGHDLIGTDVMTPLEPMPP